MLLYLETAEAVAGHKQRQWLSWSGWSLHPKQHSRGSFCILVEVAQAFIHVLKTGVAMLGGSDFKNCCSSALSMHNWSRCRPGEESLLQVRSKVVSGYAASWRCLEIAACRWKCLPSAAARASSE